MMISEPLLLRTEDSAIIEIADMIRRDGNRLYGGAEGGQAYQASLCGLTAGFAHNGDVMMLKGADLHVDVILSVAPVDENDGIDHYKDERTTVQAAYRTGDITALRNWHRHLSAYRRSMRVSSSIVAA